MRSAARADDRPKTQTAIVCGHCHTKAPMTIVSASSVVERGPSRRSAIRGEMLWETLSCSKCSMVSLRTGHSARDDGEPFKWDIVYPETRRAHRSLPFDIARAYESAMLMRSVDPNAYAVVLGTVLDIICSDRGAWGQNLAYRLLDLASRSLIPPELAELGQRIPVFMSAADRGGLRDLDAADLPVLEPLCEALIVYLYVAPAFVDAAKLADRGRR
jgi:hypothetical protein